MPKNTQKRGFGEFQEQTKKKHKSEIISVLQQHGPLRFNQLKTLVKRNSAGVSTTLGDLSHDKLIEYETDPKTRKVLIKLSPKGQREFHDWNTIPTTLSWIEKEDGKMISDYSGFQTDMWFCYLPWGIRDDLAMSKSIDEKINPISREFVMELQKLLFKNIKSHLKSQSMEKLRSVKGNIVLGFDIDFGELVKSIDYKNLFKIREGITEPELDILERVQLGKSTKEDDEKFSAMLKYRSEL